MILQIGNQFVHVIILKMMLYDYWKDRREEKFEDGKHKKFILLKSNLQILRFFTLLPGKGQDMTPTTTFYLTISATLVISSSLFFGSLFHLIHTLNNNIDTDVTEDFAIMATYLGGSCVAIIFVYKRQSFIRLYTGLCSTEYFGGPKRSKDVSKKDDLAALMFYYYIKSACLLYGLSNYLSRGECQRINKQKNINEYCGLHVHAWMPFDLNNFVYRHIFFALQQYSALFFLGSGTGICYLMQSCISQIVVRIEHLNSLFEKFIMMDIYSQEKRRLINRCIAYHLNIIELVKEIHICFSTIMFILVAIAGVGMACIGVQMLKEPPLGPILHLTGWSISMFVICHAGQMLTDQSETTGYTIIGSPWYDLPLDLRKDLVLVIMRSNKHLVVPIGFLGVMSHELYVKIMRAGYMYLNTLYQMNM